MSRKIKNKKNRNSVNPTPQTKAKKTTTMLKSWKKKSGQVTKCVGTHIASAVKATKNGVVTATNKTQNKTNEWKENLQEWRAMREEDKKEQQKIADWANKTAEALGVVNNASDLTTTAKEMRAAADKLDAIAKSVRKYNENLSSYYRDNVQRQDQTDQPA